MATAPSCDKLPPLYRELSCKLRPPCYRDVVFLLQQTLITGLFYDKEL